MKNKCKVIHMIVFQQKGNCTKSICFENYLDAKIIEENFCYILIENLSFEDAYFGCFHFPLNSAVIILQTTNP